MNLSFLLLFILFVCSNGFWDVGNISDDNGDVIQNKQIHPHMSRQNSCDLRYPIAQYKLNVDFKCSRFYPIIGTNLFGRKSLLLILKEINKKTKDLLTKNFEKNDEIIDNIPWMKMLEVFLPLPQWRRAETALLFCENELDMDTQDLNKCLENIFADYTSYKSMRTKLLTKLIKDKNEELATIIYHILLEDSSDFDTLYDIILARPKFELQKIIFHYNKIYEIKKLENPELQNFITNFEENNKSNSVLEMHLKYKKQLENKNEIVEIYDILIKRVETNNKIFDDNGFKKISTQIITFCDNFNNNIKGDITVDDNGVSFSFTHAFAALLINLEFKSKSVLEFSDELFNKCNKECCKQEITETLKKKTKFQKTINIFKALFVSKQKQNLPDIKPDNKTKGIELPEYMKRMLIITGLAGKKKYREDIANRMKHYIDEKEFEKLINLIVIHYGSDIFEAVKIMEELFEKESTQEELLIKESVELKTEGVKIMMKLKEEKLTNKEKKEELKNKIEEIELEEMKLKEVELKKRLKEEKKMEENMKNKLKEEQLNELRNNVESFKTDLFRIKEDIFEVNMKIRAKDLNNKLKEIKMKMEKIQEKLKNEKPVKELEERLKNQKMDEEKLKEELEEAELKNNLSRLRDGILKLRDKIDSGEGNKLIMKIWEEELSKMKIKEEKLREEMKKRQEKLREEMNEELELEEEEKEEVEEKGKKKGKMEGWMESIREGSDRTTKGFKGLKEELEKLTLNESKMKEEKGKNKKKLGIVEDLLSKIKGLKKIDGNYYGLLAFFKYTLSSKCSKACCGEIETEYEWERKLGELEYEHEVGATELTQKLLDCSRIDGVDHKHHLKNIIVDESYKNLRKKEFVWKLLANYLVPLPRWKRQKVVLETCRSFGLVEKKEKTKNPKNELTDHEERHEVENIKKTVEEIEYPNEGLTECLNDLFFGKNNWGFASINKIPFDRSYKKAAQIFINMIEEKPRLLGKIIFDQIESRNPDLKLIYEVLFARPRYEIKPIIKEATKYYPFNENIEKIYEKNHDKLVEYGKTDNPLLWQHIKLKIKNIKDEGLKQVYQMFCKRIDAISKGIGIVNGKEVDEVSFVDIVK
uniref:Uncharacterized protein n=1 Tax=Meloidogyne hapla TaxID=6305 RepID=A0A1I8BT21_MELHA